MVNLKGLETIWIYPLDNLRPLALYVEVVLGTEALIYVID